MLTQTKALERRLDLLEAHLRAEHPHLLRVLPTFRAFDRLLYRMGLLAPSESLAMRIPWWPLISILGLFSSGKSSFINSYLGTELQNTGNQAVDDRFTVICFGPDRRYDSLPGTALNADPRFPFFRMSDEIEKVAVGEGKRIDAYLQLKTSASPRVRGKIIIDSPGFDADDQRRSTLRMVDHIIDLSDLVLVFFDARRPEPGSMQDTLEHLVAKTVRRPDSRKFLYILNQLDTASREDNPEEIVGAWQRAIAQAGLVSGRFYGIYNRDVAPVIEDDVKRQRYEAKSDEDLAEILARMDEIEYGRGYRIVGVLDALTRELSGEIVPVLESVRQRWRRQVLVRDSVMVAAVVVALAGAALVAGLDAVTQVWQWLLADRSEALWDLPVRLVAVGAGLAAVLLAGHYGFRRSVANRLERTLPERLGQLDLNLRLAFRRNTGMVQSLFRRRPVGWTGFARKQLFAIQEVVARHVQEWNDQYTDPAGARMARDAASQSSRRSSWGGRTSTPRQPSRPAPSGATTGGPATPVAAAEGLDPVAADTPSVPGHGGGRTGGLIDRLKTMVSSR